MKTTLVMLAIMSAPIFCLALQQSAVTPQGTRGPVLVDVNDSDAFFQTATLAPFPARDNKRRVEALLPRRTLEEKVGQMTQLEIGMVTTGKDQEIQIDTATL